MKAKEVFDSKMGVCGAVKLKGDEIVDVCAYSVDGNCGLDGKPANRWRRDCCKKNFKPKRARVKEPEQLDWIG